MFDAIIVFKSIGGAQMNPHHNTKRHHTHENCEMVIDVNRRDHYGQPALCCSEHMDKKGRPTWIDWLSKTDEIALLNIGVKQTTPTSPSPLMLKALANKPDSYIDDIRLFSRWKAIKKHFSTPKGYNMQIVNGMLYIERSIFLAKKSRKMRLRSRIDWVYYDPKQLAHALETNTVEQYYANEIGDTQSNPNDWKRIGEEIDIKAHYAHRVGRQLDSLDNI